MQNGNTSFTSKLDINDNSFFGWKKGGSIIYEKKIKFLELHVFLKIINQITITFFFTVKPITHYI